MVVVATPVVSGSNGLWGWLVVITGGCGQLC